MSFGYKGFSGIAPGSYESGDDSEVTAPELQAIGLDACAGTEVTVTILGADGPNGENVCRKPQGDFVWAITDPDLSAEWASDFAEFLVLQRTNGASGSGGNRSLGWAGAIDCSAATTGGAGTVLSTLGGYGSWRRSDTNGASALDRDWGDGTASVTDTTDWHWTRVRYEVDGLNVDISAKSWDYGSPEPETWDATRTLGGMEPNSGVAGLGIFGHSINVGGTHDLAGIMWATELADTSNLTPEEFALQAVGGNAGGGGLSAYWYLRFV